MTVIIDAGPLVAFADANDPLFQPVDQVLRTVDGPLIVPAPVTAEVDYLLGQRLGHGPRRDFIADLAAGRFTVACLEREDYVRIAQLDRRYEDLQLGLADCSLVVLAERFHTDLLLTFEERHFRTVTPLGGGAFTILPADR